MMRSHIDGMMANYDQISAEREELLESLAEVNMKSLIEFLNFHTHTHTHTCSGFKKVTIMLIHSLTSATIVEADPQQSQTGFR